MSTDVAVSVKVVLIHFPRHVSYFMTHFTVISPNGGTSVEVVMEILIVSLGRVAPHFKILWFYNTMLQIRLQKKYDSIRNTVALTSIVFYPLKKITFQPLFEFHKTKLERAAISD